MYIKCLIYNKMSDHLQCCSEVRRATGSPPATKSLMLESVRGTQAASGYCYKKRPKDRGWNPHFGLGQNGPENLLTRRACFSSPVNVIMFVEVLKPGGNFTRHLLEDERVRGGWTCCPAATEVSFDITLKSIKNYSSTKLWSAVIHHTSRGANYTFQSAFNVNSTSVVISH